MANAGVELDLNFTMPRNPSVGIQYAQDMSAAMRLNSPLISIYLPTHNRVTLLRRAAASVLAQSYKNVELIFVDDASDDGTAAYLSTLVKEDCRVRVITNMVNRGACAYRNFAIVAADGRYITGIDDDFIQPSRIERFVAEAWRLQEFSFISSRYLLLTRTGELRAL